jgi:hypothetical protein
VGGDQDALAARGAEIEARIDRFRYFVYRRPAIRAPVPPAINGGYGFQPNFTVRALLLRSQPKLSANICVWGYKILCMPIHRCSEGA